MTVLPTDLDGVLVLEPRVFADARGFFMETWHAERYAEHGLPVRFEAATRPGRRVIAR